jgi:hypothetical protein
LDKTSDPANFQYYTVLVDFRLNELLEVLQPTIPSFKIAASPHCGTTVASSYNNEFYYGLNIQGSTLDLEKSGGFSLTLTSTSSVMTIINTNSNKNNAVYPMSLDITKAPI